MQDLKLDNNNDLDISQYGLQLITGTEQVAQRLAIALNLFLGEWNFDISKGVPYYEDIFIKGQDPAVLENVFKKAILNVPDVNKILSFDLNISGRELTLSFSADTTYGEVNLEDII